MAEFKPGDRVLYTGLAAHGNWGRYKANRTPATVKRHFGSDLDLKFDGDDKTYMVLPDMNGNYDLELIEANGSCQPPLVGPKPKVVYPRIVSPFTFEHGAIFEDSQCEVLKISDWIGEHHGGQTVSEFGKFVAEALNEKVNREEAA